MVRKKVVKKKSKDGRAIASVIVNISTSRPRRQKNAISQSGNLNSRTKDISRGYNDFQNIQLLNKQREDLGIITKNISKLMNILVNDKKVSMDEKQQQQKEQEKEEVKNISGGGEPPRRRGRPLGSTNKILKELTLAGKKKIEDEKRDRQAEDTPRLSQQDIAQMREDNRLEGELENRHTPSQIFTEYPLTPSSS